MYKISLINNGVEQTIHYPHHTAPTVLKCEIEEAINTVTQMNLSLDITNRIDINLFKTIVKLVDITDNSTVFLGRILKQQESMGTSGDFTKELNAEEVLGILNDSYVRTYIVKKTPLEILTYYLSKAVKWNGYSFRVGTVEDSTEAVSIEVGYETVLSCVLSLADVIDRKIRTRIEGNIIYIDLVKNLSSSPIKTVQMGVNMLSVTKELDTSDFATRIIPLASGDNSKKITIKSVNNNLDYIQDDAMVAEYGVIEMVCEDTGTIKNASTLLKWAKTQLNTYKAIKLVLDCSAVDLSYLSNVSFSRINLDDQIQIINNPLGVNVVVRVLTKKWSIFQAYNPQISLSSRKYTATDEILDIRNRQRIKNRTSILDAQYVTFEDNITASKPIVSEFSLSGTFEDAYIDLATMQYRYYTATGESYTTYPATVKIYVNNTLAGTLEEGENVSSIVNIASYIQTGLNTVKITTTRNGRIAGKINITARM